MHFRSQRKSATDVSLSDFIESGGDGNTLSLMDVLCSDEDLFENLSDRELCGQLRVVLNRCLSRREQEILTLRYGLDGRLPLTQKDVAKHCGISRSYVSRIEKKALTKLRTELQNTKF